jgi:hypothetical protein
MPKFTLQQLFIGVTILSMLLAAISFVIRFGILAQAAPPLLVMAYFTPGAIVGALLLAPIKRPRSGMLLGIIAEFFILYIWQKF